MNEFANLFAGNACGLLDAGNGYEVQLYVAGESGKVREAFELDQDDAAGSLFDIPMCCQTFFGRLWKQIALQGGDLFATLLRRAPSKDGRLVIPWSCNAAAMYFGGGLCWHFPCSLDCEATRVTIDARRRALLSIDSDLATRLVAIQNRAFLWSPETGYGLLPEGPIDEIQLDTILWSGSAPATSRAQGVLSWLDEHRVEGWRLILPYES